MRLISGARPGENEQLSALGMLDTSRKYAAQQAQGGSLCLVDGFYLTPALERPRRRFTKGDKFPDPKCTFGETYWQWDINQEEVT
jgi:hypothetical protein